MLQVSAAMAVIPLILGMGALVLIEGNRTDKKICLWESYLCGLICCIGIFQIAHMVGVFCDKSISECGNIALLLMGVAVLISVSVLIVKRQRIARLCRMEKLSGGVLLTGMFFLLLVGLQIGYVLSAPMLFTPGDILQETVYSFLAEDKIYGVSPLTGKAYGGAPLRYKILCLPTVYTLLSRWTAAGPDMIMDQMIPVLVTLASYMSYYLLSGVLISEGEDKQEKRLWFVIMAAAIFFLCEKNTYMEGYGILHAAHMGTTMRNSILIPLVLYASLEKKWALVLGCILAEACICWTLWGLGVGVVVTVGVLAMRLIYNHRKVQTLFDRWMRGEGRE